MIAMKPLPIVCLGGGPSLIDWNFDQLKNYHVIGCNNAYKLGTEIVNETVFQDYPFWFRHQDGLCTYFKDGGKIITNNSSGAFRNKEEIRCVKKLRTKLATDDHHLFWKGCVGHSAINLALLRAREAASLVLLLGFDHQQTKNRNNWYTNKHKPDKFHSYTEGFDIIRDSDAFDIKIINLNPNSALTQWKKRPREEFFDD